jgi:hypothetical protein
MLLGIRKILLKIKRVFKKMKKKCFFIILFLIFAMFLVGCADTTLSTIRNPELSSGTFLL